MLRDFLDLFFPNYCLTCPNPLVKGETLLCTGCCYDLPQTTYHQEPNNIIFRQLLGQLPVTHAMAMYQFRQSGRVQQLLHHLKYKNKPIIGKILGKKYGTLLREAQMHRTFDLIVPVPLHRSRLRQRGYNQSDFFAKGLAETLRIPWSNKYLQCVKKTATQTKKGKIERLDGLESTFHTTHAATTLSDKHLLLVDDVMTTGATLAACGAALLATGIRQVSTATIAVVV